MTEIVRLHINLNRETAAELDRLSKAHGLSLTEVVRRAISLYGFINDEVAAGRTVTTGTRRKRRELVLL
ncbi:ribbon-helix-helix protein, CopG family [Agromyces cerinus]|uniref:Ribbon-helix-helix protein, copG family n=1 Tax=Agromyces cerinus subsp. cerinus TaxID=232089 RepID=A0A1N6DPG0_9MICO|nr:ribbon-helix-helix protein, CopG family [Agromyces cerinus]SIN72626.1 Ribbon-helix-helix protein, copG family [Agromyces cerinus subsp. cerinus]